MRIDIILCYQSVLWLKISPDGYCKGTTINSVTGAENREDSQK
jgi:hypothetical protein